MNFSLLLLSFLYVFLTPYTKVEESFNVQAMHDILYHKLNLSKYDHHEFPGVVPRTFIGPLAVSFASSPLVALLDFLNANKFIAQYIVRCTLATFVWFSWSQLRNTFQKQLGSSFANWFLLITLTQFHFAFYMSRPLPNIMALPLVLLTVNSWLKNERKKFIFYAGASIIIFRSELLMLLGLFVLYDLILRKISIIELLKIGIPTGIFLVILTTLIDSFFWQRLLWPEAEVLYFNTILNKSSEWGTSPFIWYFKSALPRALGASLIFVPYGLFIESRIRPITLSALTFIFLYSFLPHKELRFIIYAFPLINIASASACSRLWNNRRKSKVQFLLALASVGHLIGNILLTIFLFTVSFSNYPGGVAMSRLHDVVKTETNMTIHIGNLAAQSGVTRFMEINPNWIYSKEEHLKIGDEKLHNFDVLLTEVVDENSRDMKMLLESHEKVEVIECFSHVDIKFKALIPVRIIKKPCVTILRKKKFI